MKRNPPKRRTQSAAAATAEGFSFRHVRTACPGGIFDFRAHKLELIDGEDEYDIFAFEEPAHSEIVSALNDIQDGLWAIEQLRFIETSSGPAHNDDEKTHDASRMAIDRLIDNLQQRARQGRRFADIDAALDAPERQQPGYAARKAVS